LGLDRRGEGFDGHGLGQTRHALQQDVAIREQTDEQALDHIVLADDHLAHFGGDLFDKGAFALDFSLDGLNIDVHYSSIDWFIAQRRMSKRIQQISN